MSPEAVQIARREELEFMNKFGGLRGVFVEQCWKRTRSSLERSGPTSTKGDGDRVQIRSRLAATDLKVHEVKTDVLRGDVFSATPLSGAVRLFLSLTVTENKQAKTYSVMFIAISRAHLTIQETSARGVTGTRERPGWRGLLLKSVYGTQDSAANIAAGCKVQLVFV